MECNIPPLNAQTMSAGLRVRTAVFVLLLVGSVVQGTFTDGFLSYVSRQYGAQASSQLARKDLGVNGSYGGNVFSFPIRILYVMTAD